MREIRDNLDLAEVQATKKGFVLNIRKDRRMLHRSGCDAVGAMVSAAYPKLFFDDPHEAYSWAIDKFGKHWKNCGFCGGVGTMLS